ncbi:hypothetical protein HF086_010197 [Spodoptera exigua]|uniref:Nardilysin n=1 Tax=Spodoptera exigua TaxID=7107 RepID=A0A922MK96_SPOEX|nr:hypothetical protein HF086_010197 [Spodoptera exigua]
MVFMGSEKYPKENEFDSFIKKKGGSDNASTDCEVTTFYFEIQEKHLPKAMDMFSQFFVSPLMMKEAMQREREAIESEFAIASPSDSNRKDQLLSSLFPEGHPARTFTWGNLRSLKDDIDDDERLHKAAHAFRKRHYSAHRMTVAVQARMDLAALESYVVNTFGHIPTNKLPSDDFSQFAFKPDTVTPEFRSIYYVKPVGDTTEVHLTWCMRSLLSEYESKPHQYISYLLGHEGKGSLLSFLRKKVWALGIYTGNSESGIDYTSMYSLFSTQVVLTKEGLDHVDEVLEAIFSYINMLKKIGPSERIYDEIRGISELLDCMRADTVNIMILSNKHSTPINYDSKEKWFGTEYKKMDPAYLEAANELGIDLKNSSVKDIHKKVEGNNKNTKILSHGDLIATVNNFRLDQPNLIRKNRHMELWYKPDFKFRFPTALLYFYFISPLSLKSPREDVRMNILLMPYVSPRDKAALIHTITLDELKDFSNRLLSKLYCQVKVHQLPLGERKIRVMSLNEASTNSIITNYYQGEATNAKDTATLEVLMLLMEEPVFDSLRTKEQLGYSVFSMMRYTFGVLGFSVTVNTQVDKFSVSYVDGRVEAFLKKFSRDMRRLTEKTLSATKHSLVQLKHTTDYELKEEVERNWREIVSREYMFHRLFLEADAIEKIKLADIKSWVDNHFPTGNKSKFRKLSVQIMGHKSNKDNATTPDLHKKHYELTYLDASDPIGDTNENNADFIRDINAFKVELPFINIPKIEFGQC